ncbi:uncharacterized protein N7458_006836 [Penicillium daleae]|uniref:BZIP domain-containing protein n=1 Tax=Penicillium daleae TaxID=63821 RepID=A0AAD6G222_9EURO|nr:uncharacterized protein N7458_006836 [Penicillium daleae]KAJ5450387.1 hypothetical protein N7458_006836 [Penicillium daleae]
MVTSNALLVRDNWFTESPAVQGRGPPRRRESRSGTRKVSSLSAEQLERKRANDREAQRSIRQRTKEHIEQLEQQVARLQIQVNEMRPRNEQFDDLVRQNAALQEEIARLKHQLAGYTGRQGFADSGWNMGEGPSTAASGIPTTGTMLSSHFSAPTHPSASFPRAPSTLSVSSRSSHPHEWQPSYSSTRSSSLGESSDPEFSARMEPYVMEGQLQASSRMAAPSLAIANSQISFGSVTSPTQSGSESSFSQMYPVGQHPQPGQRGDGLQPVPHSSMNQPAAGYLPGHRSMSLSMPSVSAPTQSAPGQPYQSPNAPYQGHPGQPPQRDPSYPYPWNPQS